MVVADMPALRWGQPAPGFSLPSTLGRSISLEELRGKDVVLAFYCYDWGNI
jgi:peroxiredoxin